jgi:hypothetical protein
VVPKTCHRRTDQIALMHSYDARLSASRRAVHDTTHETQREMLEPDKYYLYEDTLQEAYDALTTVEDAVTTLGMKLEYQHWRLGGAVDELRPLMIQTRSLSDLIMEAFEKKVSKMYDEL